MTIHWLGHCHFYLKSLMTILIFLNYEKSRILYQSTKKLTNEIWKIIAPFHCYLFSVKYLKKQYLTKCITFLQNEQLLNPNQSGFRPSDSCINQLLSITHEIFQSFDATLPLEVRLFFLDISRAIDKAWH